MEEIVWSLAEVSEKGWSINDINDALNMYREQGFQEIEKQDSVSVIWLEIPESATEAAPDLMGLFNYWETNGYPDDVGGVYYDNATGNMVIMLVNGSEMRKQEILAMEQNMDSTRISFGESLYSYNEMLAVQKKIEVELEAGNSKIYSIGICSTDC